MKKIMMMIITASLLFALASCDQGLFETNIFAGFEKYEAPDTANADSLLEVQDDDRFFEEVAEMEEAEVAEIVATLDAVITDPESTDEEVQDAALMQADVAMAASGADEVFTNFNTVIGDFVADSTSETGDEPDMGSVGGIVEALFMPDAENPPTAESIADQLVGLMNVADSLSSYGDTLVLDDGVDQTPDDENAGDLAAQALLAGVSTLLIDSVINTNGDVSTPEEAAVEIAAALLTPTDPANPDTTGPAAELEALVAGDPSLELAEGESFTDILDAGLVAVVFEGLDLSALGL